MYSQITNIYFLHNIFLRPEEKLCLKVIIINNIFSLQNYVQLISKCTDVYAFFMDECSGGVNPKVRQEFCKQKKSPHLCIDN